MKLRQKFCNYYARIVNYWIKENLVWVVKINLIYNE